MAKSRARSTINVRLGQSYALQKVVSGVNLAAAEGENQLIDIYSIPPTRSGVQYDGNPNVSSAPGEAPAPQSGLLRQGVAHTNATLRGQTVSALVASRGKQAALLEFGTEKIEPRPAVSRLRDEAPRLARLRAAFTIGARRVR